MTKLYKLYVYAGSNAPAEIIKVKLPDGGDDDGHAAIRLIAADLYEKHGNFTARDELLMSVFSVVGGCFVWGQ